MTKASDVVRALIAHVEGNAADVSSRVTVTFNAASQLMSHASLNPDITLTDQFDDVSKAQAYLVACRQALGETNYIKAVLHHLERALKEILAIEADADADNGTLP